MGSPQGYPELTLNAKTKDRVVANPSGIPPLPTTGNPRINTTFASVGRALTTWEGFEVQLANVFAAICGAPDDTMSAIRAYGSVVSFKGRSTMLKAAAEAYFHRFPNEGLASQLKALLSTANELSGRRNEIAHGIVTGFKENGAPGAEFALYPAAYASNKQTLSGGPNWNVLIEKYIYTSTEIDQFQKQFSTLYRWPYTFGPHFIERGPQHRLDTSAMISSKPNRARRRRPRSFPELHAISGVALISSRAPAASVFGSLSKSYPPRSMFTRCPTPLGILYLT